MDPIFSDLSHLWHGLSIAAVFLVLRSMERIRSKRGQVADGDPGRRERSPFLKAANFFLFDGVFALSYLMLGLQAALIFRLVVGVWEVFRKLIAGYEQAPFLLLYLAVSNIILTYTVIEGSLGGLHVYGLVVFTFWYLQVVKGVRSKFERDECGGSLAVIRFSGTMGITYLLLIGLGEYLWALGGVGYWIWFLVFVKLLAIIGGLLSVLLLLPFLKLLMRSIQKVAGPLG